MVKNYNPKKMRYFVGIDVSRNELDFAVLKGAVLLFHREVPNDVESVNGLLIELKKLPNFRVGNTLFCMEFTGYYNNHLLKCLRKIKANIVQKDALFIRNSLGTMRGKYDKIDAIRIAQFAYKARDELKLWQPKRPVIEELAQLMTLRDRLQAVRKALGQPLTAQEQFVYGNWAKQARELCGQSLLSLSGDTDIIERKILNVIASDEMLKRMYEIIVSVPRVGWVTAVYIIIHTNELKDISKAKQFACYAGIAPFQRESGSVTKKARVSHIANKKVKAILHMCACGVLTQKNELRDYYERKTIVEGKSKMLVLNAIRNKIVLRVFACLNQDRLYTDQFQAKLDQRSL